MIFHFDAIARDFYDVMYVSHTKGRSRFEAAAQDIYDYLAWVDATRPLVWGILIWEASLFDGEMRQQRDLLPNPC